jgi:hypothetical protein
MPGERMKVFLLLFLQKKKILAYAYADASNPSGSTPRGRIIS